MRGDEATSTTSGTGSLSFWNANQPGLRFARTPPGTRAFYADIEATRYRLEPHIPDIVRFERWVGCEVLEAGCGIATDGTRFARAGARYTGVDQSPQAIELARERFAFEGLPGTFVAGAITKLPFEDDSFDLVYSHGVIHHIDDTRGAVDEFHRVLRPGARALVMVYHRASFNYWFTIMGVRRLLAATLLVPGAVEAVARLTGESPATLEGQRALLRAHGRLYLADSRLFLSNNTDGPGNPLSKAYTRVEVRQLFDAFDDVRLKVRHLNLRLFPGGEAFAHTAAARRLERRLGWHLYIEARKRGATSVRRGSSERG